GRRRLCRAFEPFERLRHLTAIAIEACDEPCRRKPQLRRARGLLERGNASVDVAFRSQRKAALVLLLRIVETGTSSRLIAHVSENSVEITRVLRRRLRRRRRRLRAWLDLIEADVDFCFLRAATSLPRRWRRRWRIEIA